jgi:hypothetical protein
MTVQNLTDLPKELLIEIIHYLRPSLDDHCEIGVNAAWTEMVGPDGLTFSNRVEPQMPPLIIGVPATPVGRETAPNPCSSLKSHQM